MKQLLVTSAACISLLAISQTAISADCLVYEASVPIQFRQGQRQIDSGVLAHTIVVRLAGFNANPVDFFIFPPAIAKDRFSLAPSSASSAESQGASNASESAITPLPPGLNDRFPTVGHIVLMSNTAFYGDLNSNTDPTQVAEVVNAAIDLAKTDQIKDGQLLFTLSPVTATLNAVFVPAADDTEGAPHIVPATQGMVQLYLLDEGRTLLGEVNLHAVDNTASPTADLQYSGIVNGTFMKNVSC